MGNYAPAPPSPYGYGAPTPQSSSNKNYLGILALIFPFVFLSLPGIIVGHLGLSAVKKGEANNRGIALAGTIISWVFTVFTVLGILASIALPVYLEQRDKAEETTSAQQDNGIVQQDDVAESVTAPQPSTGAGTDSGTDTASTDGVVPFSDLELGHCIADPYENSVQDADGTSWLEGVMLVDCATVHYGEVYAVLDIEGDDPYVEDDVYSKADDLCYYAFEDYMGVSYEESMYYYDPFYPTAKSWAYGDRETTCVVTSGASDTVGTLQGSGS